MKQLIGQALALVAAGILVGAVNNLAAGDSRRLDWVSDYPEKKIKDCRTEAPAPPASAPPPVGVPGGVATADPSSVPTMPVPELPAKDPGVPYVEVVTAQSQALHAKGALFLDARLSKQYEEGHVPGAVSVAVWEAGLEEKVQEMPFRVEGNLGRAVVVYCNGGDCEDSHTLAEKLSNAGFTNVHVDKDGYPGWVKAGHPTATGGAP